MKLIEAIKIAKRRHARNGYYLTHPRMPRIDFRTKFDHCIYLREIVEYNENRGTVNVWGYFQSIHPDIVPLPVIDEKDNECENCRYQDRFCNTCE